MAVISDITTGTISVANGSADVTGTGTAWLIQGFKEGDLFVAIGPQLIAVVQSVNSNTSITLAKPWEGPTLTGAPYRLRYAADNERVTAKAQQLIDSLSDGMLGSISDLVPASNKLIGFDGSGEGALFDFNAEAQNLMSSVTPWLNSFADLTMGADQLPYGTGANTMGLTPLTAQARSFLAATSVADQQWALGISAFIRTLLDDPDASTAQTTLGISAFAKTLLDDANAAAAFATLGGSSGPGWVRLPGGLLIQWGTTLQVTSSGGGVQVNLPTAYSNANYSIMMQQWRNSSFTLIPQLFESGFPTASAFFFLVKQTHLQNAAYASATIQVSWITVGI